MMYVKLLGPPAQLSTSPPPLSLSLSHAEV